MGMAETVEKKVPNPTGKGGFQKGSAGGPGRGKKKPKSAAGIDLFADMKKAYETPESPDDSHMVKKFREQAHENPELFIRNFFKAMGAGGVKAEVEESEAAASPKEERIEKLADRLLDEWEEEDGEVRGE